MKCPFPIPLCLVAAGVIVLGLVLLSGNKKELKQTRAKAVKAKA